MRAGSPADTTPSEAVMTCWVLAAFSLVIPTCHMDSLTPLPALPDWPHWASALTSADFAVHGLTVPNAATGLIRLASDDAIDLSRVCACLELLCSGPYLLHAGQPLALMSYSPAKRLYRACFDGAIDLEPSLLTQAQAGLWLTLLASEAPLPQTPDDWSVLSIQATADGLRLSGLDTASAELYHAYADVLDDPTPIDPDRYDAWISRAVWTCVRHALIR